MVFQNWDSIVHFQQNVQSSQQILIIGYYVVNVWLQYTTINLLEAC